MVVFAALAAAADTIPAAWTLQQCIERAKSENVGVRRGRLDVQQSALDLDNAKKAWLPQVGFTSNQSVGLRPFQKTQAIVSGDQVVSTSTKGSYTGSYGLSASMPLYDGGVIKNNIKLQEINSQMAQLSVDQSELSIEESVTQVFIQILYIKETIKQDEEQIALSQQQVDRAKALFQSGLLNRADVAQLESQLASDRYQLVADQSSLTDYELQLKQLMELDGNVALTLVTPSLVGNVLAPLPLKNEVFEAALMLRPEIQSQQLAIKRSDVDIDIAKAGMSPTINANAGSSTSNMTSNGNFFEQLYRQWNNTLGVSISIPLYDRGKTKNAIARARLDKEDSYLSLLDTRKSLWKTIESYWQNANNAQQRYVAAQARVEAAQASYALTSEQFRLGLKNIVELMTDKTNLSSAQHQMLQAKYMAILNEAMLRFYRGDSIN